MPLCSSDMFILFFFSFLLLAAPICTIFHLTLLFYALIISFGVGVIFCSVLISGGLVHIYLKFGAFLHSKSGLQAGKKLSSP